MLRDLHRIIVNTVGTVVIVSYRGILRARSHEHRTEDRGNRSQGSKTLRPQTSDLRPQTSDLRRRTTHDKRVQRLVCQRAQRSGSVVCGLSASAAKRVWSEAQPSESYSPQPLPPLIDVIVLVSA